MMTAIRSWEDRLPIFAVVVNRRCWSCPNEAVTTGRSCALVERTLATTARNTPRAPKIGADHRKTVCATSRGLRFGLSGVSRDLGSGCLEVADVRAVSFVVSDWAG